MNPTEHDAAPIDLSRYPILDLEEPRARALIDACRGDLAATGACALEGFVQPGVLDAMITEIAPHLDKAFYKAKRHNPYLLQDDPAYPADHPRNLSLKTDSATLAGDLMPRGCRLDRLYRWPPLHAFIARVLEFDALYPYADPLAGLNVLVYRAGSQTAWHFDNANFVVTLLLRPAETGGVYEYAPFIRSRESEAFERVAEVLAGGRAGVLELRQGPGALVMFQGRNTLHRVTPVQGAEPRLVGVFSYDPEPGRMLAEHTRRTFYGRAN